MAVQSTYRVLGIDPGLQATGFGIIEAQGRRARLLSHGVIETNAKTPLPERLAQIHQGIEQAIQAGHPDRAAFEKLIYAKNVSIALLLGQARGAALVACAQHALPMVEFSPTEIKSCIVGRGRANKTQVQKMVQVLLNMPECPASDHAADALAAALADVYAKPMRDKLQSIASAP